MPSIDFFKAALKDYGEVGAFVRSSRYTIERILEALTPQDQFIVEYGAGDGAVTRGLLGRLSPEARVTAVEINKELAVQLERISDPRLRVVKDDALNVSRRLSELGLPRIDAVICGVPLSTRALVDPEIRAVQREIIANSAAALAPGGRFILYQHTLVAVPTLKKFFADVEWRFEPRNLFPYIIMVAKK